MGHNTPGRQKHLPLTCHWLLTGMIKLVLLEWRAALPRLEDKAHSSRLYLDFLGVLDAQHLPDDGTIRSIVEIKEWCKSCPSDGVSAFLSVPVLAWLRAD